MVKSRITELLIIATLLALNITMLCYIPMPHVKCGDSVSDYRNVLVEKPDNSDEYYEKIIKKKIRIVTSRYATDILAQHPEVALTQKYVDAGFTHKTFIRTNGKDYWIYNNPNVEVYDELNNIIDDVAADLWRQIKTQISFVFIVDVLLIVLLFAMIAKSNNYGSVANKRAPFGKEE